MNVHYNLREEQLREGVLIVNASAVWNLLEISWSHTFKVIF